MPRRLYLITLACGTLTGCAGVNPGPDFNEVAQAAQARTGRRPRVWLMVGIATFSRRLGFETRPSGPHGDGRSRDVRVSPAGGCARNSSGRRGRIDEAGRDP